MNDMKPVIIQIHPMLLNEMKLLKQKIEDNVGYKIYGGMPIVSKILALKLKEQRLKIKKYDEFSYEKVRHEKKIKIIFPEFLNFEIDKINE